MRGLGPDAAYAVGPTEVLVLDFLCSSIQLYLLLSPLYLDLYVLGDNSWIS